MIYLASDHAGFHLKDWLVQKLSDSYEVRDLGALSEDPVDYPDFALKVAKEVQTQPDAIGILVCGSGIGMSIAANKVEGVRAAVVSEPYSARMAREHNHAQILCLGSRVVEDAKAFECVRAFLEARPNLEDRHRRRVEKIHAIEENEKKTAKL